MNQGAIEACQNAKKRVAQESCRIEKIGHALVLSPIQRILFPNNFVINEILITCFLNVFHCCEHKNYFLVAINNSIATISFFANPPYKIAINVKFIVSQKSFDLWMMLLHLTLLLIQQTNNRLVTYDYIVATKVVTFSLPLSPIYSKCHVCLLLPQTELDFHPTVHLLEDKWRDLVPKWHLDVAKAQRKEKICRDMHVFPSFAF